VENPATWNVLTAALAHCDLGQPAATWALLRRIGVVAEGGETVLAGACAALQARPPGLVGRSGASQVAGELMRAGFAARSGLAPDPQGAKAAKLLRRRRP